MAVVTLAAGFWLLRYRLSGRSFEWGVFRATLAGLQWGWLAGSCVAVTGAYAGRALRWRVLMRPVKPRPRLWNLFSATVIGFTAITLLGRPGELVRPYLIAAKEKVSMSSQIAALILERIFDLLTALAIFGFALSRVRRSGASLGPALSWVFATGGWLVAVLSVLTLGLLFAFRRFSGAMRRRLLDALHAMPEHHLKKADRLITAFVQGIESTRDDRALAAAVGYTILEWTVISITTFCVMRAFHNVIQFGWLDVLIFVGFLSFGAVVQIPGIGGGMQVVAVLVLTELFRVPLEVSTSVALVLWIISFVVVVPPGLLLAVHEGVRWAGLRRLEPEVTQ